MRSYADDENELSVAAACYGGEVFYVHGIFDADEARQKDDEWLLRITDGLRAGIERQMRKHDLPVVRDRRYGADVDAVPGRTVVYVVAWVSK